MNLQFASWWPDEETVQKFSDAVYRAYMASRPFTDAIKLNPTTPPTPEDDHGN